MEKSSVQRWWAISRDAAFLWLDRNAFSHAGALAFYTLFSLAPVFIIAVTVIGVVFGEQEAHGEIVGQLQGLLGREAAQAVEQAVARSRIHLRTKGAEVPFEDEKFSYVTLVREAPSARVSRVLAPPRGGSGKVQLKLCRPDGSAGEALVTRREGERFRRARRVEWGDGF